MAKATIAISLRNGPTTTVSVLAALNYQVSGLAEAIASIVSCQLTEVETEAKKTLCWALARQISLANLPTLIKDGHIEVEKGMAPSKVYEKIKAVNVDTIKNNFNGLRLNKIPQ